MPRLRGPMPADLRTGRRLGSLLLLQLAGLIVPFVLLTPVATSVYLETGASGTGQIRIGLLLLLANGALTTSIALLLYPRVVGSSPALARWLVLLGGSMLVLQAVDNAHVMEMLALSEAYGAPGRPDGGALFEILGPAAAAARRGTHYAVLLAIEAWMLVFYAVCWRTRAVPWGVAAFGVLAAALHVAGATMPVFLATPALVPLTMVLAASHVTIAAWLITRGWATPIPDAAPDRSGVT